jgi:hypothetical protein
LRNDQQGRLQDNKEQQGANTYVSTGDSMGSRHDCRTPLLVVAAIKARRQLAAAENCTCICNSLEICCYARTAAKSTLLLLTTLSRDLWRE